MQPKFTPQRLGYFCTRIIALALILTATAQFSFSQQNPARENAMSVFEAQKLKATQNAKTVQPTKTVQAKTEFSKADNDLGMPNKVVQTNNPQGVCQSFTGSLGPGDLTMTNRLNRNGVQGVCPGPKPYAGNLTGNTYYDLHTWTNTTGMVQCATFTLNTTDVTTNIEFGVYSGPFNPANLGTNFFTDPGLSSGTPPATTSCSANVGIGQTLTFVIFTPNAALQTASDYTLTVEMPIGCGAAPPCSWTASTVYPINVLDQGTVTIGTNIYSFAGVSANAVIANSYKFDGTVWTAIAPTPQALEYPGVCTDGTNAYILGGASNVGTPLTTLYRYNVATNTYTTLAPFSTGVWNTAAVYSGGKIYKIGGTGPGTASTSVVEIYDIASNTWSLGAPYPIAASFISAIPLGGFIYTAGGNASGTEQVKTYQYSIAGNSWNDAAIADLSATRWGAAYSFYNNSFVLAGGYSAATITNTAIAWDQASNTWSALPNMLANRARMNGAVLGGAFYVIGGREANNFNGNNNNQRLFCIPPTPCTGTPDPGNTISTTNPVCSGTGFTLSLQNNPFLSGFTYQWQQSSNNVTYTNILGATNATLSTTQSAATWYRCNVTCTPSGLTGTSTPLLVADGQGIFTSQPSNVTIQCSGVASFGFTATGASLTYKWEYRTSPAGVWLNLTGPSLLGATVSGQTTNTITLTNVSQALNGFQFRGLMEGPCTAVDFTNVATLTVNPLLATVTPTSAQICTGTILKLTLTNTPTPTVFSSGPINVPIPDNTNVATTQVLAVSGLPAAIPSDIRVTLNMAHTYPADMVFNLKAPNGMVLSLYKHNTNTDNGAAAIPTAGFYDAVVSKLGTVVFKNVPTPFRYGQTPPAGPFAADALNGVTNPGYIFMDPPGYVSNALTFDDLASTLNGNWTLAMLDGGPGDVGALTSWSISFSFGASAGVWTASPAAPNTMWINAGATIPYVPGSLQGSIWVNPTVNTNYSVVYSTSTPCVSPPTVIPVSVFNPVNFTLAQQPANTTVCVGSNATFTVSPTGGPLTYQWQVSVNNGLTYTNISGATSPTLTLSSVVQLMNNNLYRCVVTSGPCGSVNSAAGRLNTNQLPVVTISSSTLQLVPGRVATITGGSAPAPHATLANWVWTLNGNTIAGATTNSVTANIDQQGTYQASVTDVNGCRNSSNSITIGSESSDRLWIYPNPNTGVFHVRLYYSRVQAERRTVYIFNMLGEAIAQKSIDMDSNTNPYLDIPFDISNFSAGTYAVKVVDKYGQKVTSGLVVIQ